MSAALTAEGKRRMDEIAAISRPSVTGASAGGSSGGSPFERYQQELTRQTLWLAILTAACSSRSGSASSS